VVRRPPAFPIPPPSPLPLPPRPCSSPKCSYSSPTYLME
jgi:hypothetical protein